MLARLFLVRELVKRDFQSRYTGSLLGFLWAFVQPLWQLLLYTFVFSTVLQVSPIGGARTASFAIFLFCGLLPWIAINEGLRRATTAITDNADLVKKMSFPSEVLILVVVISGLIQEGIAASVFFVVLAATGSLGWQGLPLLLLAMPLQVALTLGLGFVMCSVHTIFRDTAQLLSLVMTGWFFLTPIVYPLARVPQPYRAWLEWNPLTTLVELYRTALLAGGPAWVEGTGRLAVISVALLALGLWLFRRLKPGFADEI